MSLGCFPLLLAYFLFLPLLLSCGHAHPCDLGVQVFKASCVRKMQSGCLGLLYRAYWLEAEVVTESNLNPHAQQIASAIW